MMSTAKNLGTVDFIAGYIVNDIMNKIAEKVFFNESAEKYRYAFSEKYQDNNEVIENVIATLNFYGYTANHFLNEKGTLDIYVFW